MRRFDYCGPQVIQAALAQVEEVVKGTVKIIARLTYRQRYEQSTGRDPFRWSALWRRDGRLAYLAPKIWGDL